MKHYLIFILVVCASMCSAQPVQLDIGTTIGTGFMEFKPIRSSDQEVTAFGVLKNKNPRINTRDFYLAVVSKMFKSFYLRSKIETINFKSEADFTYLQQCFACPVPIDTINYLAPVSIQQIALDILAEHRAIEKDKWNIYYNAGVSIIKISPTSIPDGGAYYGKLTALVNLGGNYWIKPHLGIHASTGYRRPSFGSTNTGSVPRVSVDKYFLSIGLSLKRENKS